MAAKTLLIERFRLSETQMTLRVMDIFFLEGHGATFLFKVGLQILKHHEHMIVHQNDMSQIISMLKRIHINSDEFIKVRILRWQQVECLSTSSHSVFWLFRKQKIILT